jgi:hypothetical protein
VRGIGKLIVYCSQNRRSQIESWIIGIKPVRSCKIIGMVVFQPESAVSDTRESCEKNWNDGIPARIGGLGYERVL